MTKNLRNLLAVIVIVVVVGGIIWYGKQPANESDKLNSTTPDLPVSATTKVSDKVSEYKNAELGFSVKYPSLWEKVETNTGVTFIMPIDKNQVSTVAKVQTDVTAAPGKCSFPPVTTIKERSTVKVGTETLNMISMTNTVQGRNYFNRMYSLDKSGICYLFSFATITQSPSSKGLSGSNATQAENNNRAIIDTADASFTNLVKSFALVTGPQGIDETKAAPAK